MSPAAAVLAQGREWELERELEREFKALASRRAFGLNFERHRPESVELPGRSVRRGDKVRILPSRGSVQTADQRLWRVKRIDGEGEALVEISSVDAQARGINDGDEVAVFNDRGRYVCVARVSKRARVGVVNGLGIWWRKLGLRGTNVNEVTSQALTDLGRAPTFYDCAVEVARVA